MAECLTCLFPEFVFCLLGALIKHVSLTGKQVTSVCFSNDGQCILLSTLENSVMLFDKDSGEMLAEYTGHKNKEFKCDSCLNHKDTHVISGSEDGKIYCWDLVRAKLTQTLDHGLGGISITSLSHHPKESCLISAAQNKLFIWRAPEPA
jgi:mitogen-activated protein kinase organizer 1